MSVAADTTVTPATSAATTRAAVLREQIRVMMGAYLQGVNAAVPQDTVTQVAIVIWSMASLNVAHLVAAQGVVAAATTTRLLSITLPRWTTRRLLIIPVLTTTPLRATLIHMRRIQLLFRPPPVRLVMTRIVAAVVFRSEEDAEKEGVDLLALAHSVRHLLPPGLI